MGGERARRDERVFAAGVAVRGRGAFIAVAGRLRLARLTVRGRGAGIAITVHDDRVVELFVRRHLVGLLGALARTAWFRAVAAVVLHHDRVGVLHRVVRGIVVARAAVDRAAGTL